MAKRKGHLSNGRGTLVIDRVFPAPIRRIKLSTGTNDWQAKRDIEDMMNALARSVPPRWDILMAIKDKRLAPMFALSLWRQGRLEEVPKADVLPPLAATWTEWLEGKSYSREYKASINSTLVGLLRQGSEAQISDLPKLLRAYREECKARGKFVQFNRAKAHCQAFVRDTLKRRHELYDDVSDIGVLAEPGVRVKRPQKPEQLMALLAKLPEPHRSMALAMAVTGMGPKEYWGEWHIGGVPPHVHIEGTKRKSRVRNVPLWTASVEPPRAVTRATFEGAWERAIGDELSIYDLRRSFAVWLAEAGVPTWRQSIYMGHSSPTQTAQYQESELHQWLEEDGDRLYSYAGVVVDPQMARAG